MSIKKNKSLSTITMILIVAFAALMANVPTSNALTSVRFSNTQFYPIIGVNTPTMISWLTTPNVLLAPAYLGLTSVWANATITFTRPDNTTEVLTGPFTATTRNDALGNLFPEVKLVYTPNMQGNWTVKFSWPGDSTYAAVTRTDTFTVGPAIPKRDVWAYLSLRPFPAIGLGQNMLINAWISPEPMTNHEYYTGYMFTFTRPDNTAFTIGPFDSESPGTVWFEYPLDQLGNWTIKFEFPGDTISNPASVTRTIMVQKDPIPYPIADTPLPTEYWTFPISVFNREWRNIAGSWLQSYYNASESSFNPYTEAPRSAHILWEIPPTSGLGGFVGGPYGIGIDGIYSVTGVRISTVLAGRGYYTSGGQINCIDMRTGEKLWNVTGSFNVGATRQTAGIFGTTSTPALYQFGSRFIVYDPLTGAMTLNVTGSAMNFFEDPYVYSGNITGRLIKWTTSGSSTNFADRIIWNVSYPFSQIANSNALLQSGLLIVRDFPAGAVAGGGTGNALSYSLGAINLTTGAVVYYKPLMDPLDPDTWNYREGPAIGSANGVVYYAALPHENEGRGYEGYDALTGNKLWTSEQPEYPWGGFWAYMPQGSAYGMNYGLGYAGVYAFNLTNGRIVWQYSAGNSGMETPYNTWVFGSTGPVIGGGIVFAPNTEHSPTLYYRGQELHAIDAFTGEKVWSILGIYAPTAVAYGTLLASETTTGISYAFGKGSTETTLSSSSKVVTQGSSILLEGTVLDQSPAQPGTPAISDANMSAWMEHLHMQQPLSSTVRGVLVSFDATDPNGNFVHIGTTTSDANGKYSFLWAPKLEGKYTVIASFEGSESYYGSNAETAIGVSAAPSVSPAPTSSPTTVPQVTGTPSPIVTSTPTTAEQPAAEMPADLYVAITAAIVIIAVIVAAAVLRRRK